MNTKIKLALKTITLSLTALLIVTTATYAVGTLTPSGTAGDDTQYSLNDIYNKLTDFTDTPTATSSPFVVPGTLTASFNTLSDIYTLLEAEEDLVPENIAAGTTIFGVVGTLSPTSPELEWSTKQGSIMNWNTAVSTCAGTVDGSTGWRLPTISELVEAISDDHIIDGGVAARFATSEDYWSGTPRTESSAWYAGWSGYITDDSVGKSFSFSVRCVR